MLPEEPGLFQLRFTEEGKNFIRKFAAISYIIMVLVIVQSVVLIYWDAQVILIRMSSLGAYAGYKIKTYDKVYPYLSILISVLGVVSNIYYTRFPRQLLQSIKINDEFGANQAFKTLLSGAVIFLIYLLILALILGWNLVAHPI